MKAWFFKLPIRHKFLLAFGSLLFLSLVLMTVGLLAIRQMLDNRSLQQDSIISQRLVEEINLKIKNFSNAGYKDIEFLENGYNAETNAIQDDLNELLSKMQLLEEKSLFLNIQNRDAAFAKLNVLHDSLSLAFSQLLQLYEQRGFKDHGLEGDLRSAIHAVEQSQYDYDLGLMLMLRRHEKDFFLRKDLKYVDKFEKDYVNFREVLALDSSETNVLIERLSDYHKKFNTVVQIEKEIGLNNESGVMGDIHTISQKFDVDMQNLSREILTSTATWDQRFLILLLTLLVVQLVAGSILAIVYSNVITRSIRELRNAMVSLSTGKFPEKLISRTNDEIAELKRAVNTLITRIKTAVNVASAIGKGNFDMEYPEEFRDDVLAQAIVDMQHQLREADSRQSLINWENEGIAKLGELIYEDNFSIGELGDYVLKTLVGHAELNQAAMYLLDEENQELVRTSTFAYGKKKYENERIDRESGLLGQAVLEKEPILLKEVPGNYVNITSGLGQATPKCIFIVPMKVQDEVVGAVEFASFSFIDENRQRFLERACESVAAAIRSRQMNERTTQLLEQSEERRQQLTSQEEELRQSTEELIATQEEMNRQKVEMEETINSLKNQLNLREKEIRSLSS
jgi:GAF domain-containing protein